MDVQRWIWLLVTGNLLLFICNFYSLSLLAQHALSTSSPQAIVSFYTIALVL